LPFKVADQKDLQNYEGSLDHVLDSSIDIKNQPHILLVEDHPANIMVATAFLETFGYGWDVANNGIEAIEMVKLQNYDLALMDVQMPSMNGFEATQIIREYETKNNKGRLPIIGMTAHAMLGDRERCLAADMDDYIAKPFNPDELQVKLTTYINKKFD
jgi:CheY-like chemotaxis protein